MQDQGKATSSAALELHKPNVHTFLYLRHAGSAVALCFWGVSQQVVLEDSGRVPNFEVHGISG